MTRLRRAAVCSTLLLASLGLSLGAAASERKFAYTYESGVLAPGELELEPWTTLRLGKADYYRRFDTRLELEGGLTDWLQTSLYLNLTANAGGPAGKRTSEFEFDGISSEWKLKLTDPVADEIGSALYLELTLNGFETEVEGKLILDKRIGGWIAGLNLVAEQVWNTSTEGASSVQTETWLELDAGLARPLGHTWSVALEARLVSLLGDGGSTVLFAGPTVSWAGPRFWATFAIQPQLGALSGSTNGGLDLVNHERAEVRLLVGAHL
jgi:hypothetical protein